MRKWLAFCTIGGMALLIGIVIVSLNVHSASTPPAATGSASPSAACTPTPAVRRPTFTVDPAVRLTPYAQFTAVARYQATYPGDVHLPARTTDLAPQIAQKDKVEIYVRLPDCSYESYLMAWNQQTIDTFIGGLQVGRTVVAIVPPSSAMQRAPAGSPPASVALPPSNSSPLPFVPATPAFPLPTPPK